MASYDSTAAWHELLDGLGELEGSFLDGDRAVQGERAVADGYRMLATILGVGLDTYLFAEPGRPVFVDTVTPFRRDRRWGGDNTDSYYAYVVLDPTRSYRIHGQRGDSAYFSLTVYNEPSPGAWSDRVIGVVNDSDLTFDADGRFEMVLCPRRPEGWDGVFVELAPDAAVALTRDYQVDPLAGRRVTWEIEALDEPEPVAHTVAATAQALRSTLPRMRTMFSIVPLAVGVRNDDERHDLGHEIAQVANTHGTAVPNADGTVTVVIARSQLAHPNAITTLDQVRGNLAFRWFLADEVPAPPEVRLVKIDEAPTAVL